MNHEVRALAKQHNLDDEEHHRLRLTFGLSCVERVRQLLEEQGVVDAMQTAQKYVNGTASLAEYELSVKKVKALATSHPGSASIDGSGHAAVSATFGVARALAGDAWNAAEYAAYASVYAYAGHAVTDPDAYQSEYRWQTDRLKSLLVEYDLC